MVPSERGSEEEENGEGVKMDLKDYVAFVIALLQTALLPVIIIIVILVSFILFLLIGRNIL